MPDSALYVRLTKVDPFQGLAYGTAAAEEVDKSGEIFDYATSKPHFEAWSSSFAKATGGKSFGNVRSMHGNTASGLLKSIEYDDANKRINIVAEIVDKGDLEKLEKGVLTGFSIGGKYAERWPDTTDKKLTRYTAIPSEISVVDNPCMPSATFDCVKEDGTTELRKFHPAAPVAVETPAPAPVIKKAAFGDDEFITQGFKTDDGQFFKTKAEARKHVDGLAKAAADAATPQGQLTAALADLGATVAKAETAAAAPVVEAPAVAPVAKRAMRLAKALKGDLKKGLYSVCQLADLVQQLSWLQDSAEYEAASEGDGSTMPATLKASVAALCAALVAMVQEETAELLADPNAPTVLMLDTFEMSAHVGSLVKLLGDKAPEALVKAAAAPAHGDADAKHLANAHDSVSAMGFGKCAGMSKAQSRFSKPVADNLQKAHDHLMKAGAPCKGKPAEAGDAKDDDAPADDEKTEKLAKALEKNESLEKTLTDAVVTVKSLVERVQKLEAQPMPRPHERPVDPRYTVVDKVADDASAALAQLTEVAKSDPQAIAKALLKLSFQHPHTIG